MPAQHVTNASLIRPKYDDIVDDNVDDNVTACTCDIPGTR